MGVSSATASLTPVIQSVIFLQRREKKELMLFLSDSVLLHETGIELEN